MSQDDRGKGSGVRGHLPTGFTLGWYGVPAKKAHLRRKLCHIMKAGGLWSVDIGGSVYLGPSNSKMDQEVQRVADELFKGAVHLVPGDYAAEDAEWMLNGLVARAMGDLKEVEDAIVELERAMAGEVEIVNPKTKQARNLVTTGDGRFHTARALMDGVDTVAQRLLAHPGTAEQAEMLRRRLSQVQAWVDKVQSSHKRYSAGKRPSRAKKEGAA